MKWRKEKSLETLANYVKQTTQNETTDNKVTLSDPGSLPTRTVLAESFLV